MDAVIADRSGRVLRQIGDYELDIGFGDVDQDFSFTCPMRHMPPDKGMVYIDGTEWVGFVDSSETDTASETAVSKGRSVSGVLSSRIIVPEGVDHVSVSGCPEAVLAQVLDLVDLSGVFEVEKGADASIDYTFERFVDAWTGIRDMMNDNSLKLSARCVEGRVILSADERVSAGGDVDSDLIDFSMSKVGRCTNHLVCAGIGENEERIIVHYYADADGNVSKDKTFSGIDMIDAYYDYRNADLERLEEDGKKKLEEMQTKGAVDVDIPDGLSLGVGDLVTSRDNRTGAEVTAEVVQKTLSVKDGIATIKYEAGSSKTSSSSISGSAESSGGGVSYVAGDGISISGGRISADVTSADLDAVSAAAESARKTASDAQAAAGAAQQTADGKAVAGHKHSASDVTSGVLPVARGGTGATSRVGVWNNVMMMELLDWETVDWNTLTDSGFARNTSLSGKNAPPCDYPYGMLEVARSNINPLAQYLIQRWTSDGMHGSYVRNGWKESDGSYSWSSWNKLTYEQNVAPKSHKHSKADVTDFPSSMPASDVSAWAKAPTKPTYTAAEVGAAPKSHRHAWGDVTGRPTEYPPEAHTHPYAGSASAGGAASSAVKLETPREIMITGAVSGSAAFDGSADVTITVEGDSAAAGFLAAHPVGFYATCKAGVDPNSVGGTWEQAPSVGPCVWLRTK